VVGVVEELAAGAVAFAFEIVDGHAMWSQYALTNAGSVPFSWAIRFCSGAIPEISSESFW
jgi:hypothetical protein